MCVSVRRDVSLVFTRRYVLPSMPFRGGYVARAATAFTLFVDEIIRSFPEDERREIQTRENRFRINRVGIGC